MVRRRGYRRRRSSRRGPPFRAWGLLYLVAVLLLVRSEQWLLAVLIAAVWLLYAAVWRMTTCRVETREGRPCRWPVRGFITSCEDYHAGLKRGLPTLVRPPGDFIPRLMWPRNDLGHGGPRTAATPQPTPGLSRRELDPAPSGSRGTELLMMWLAIGSLVVAVAAFIRDLAAG